MCTQIQKSLLCHKRPKCLFQLLVQNSIRCCISSSLSSSSSCRTASTDIPDPLSPLFPIIHCFWQVFRVHPVSSHSCCMYVWAGRPAFAWSYAGVHRSTSLMSSSLLLQQGPACLVRLICIVFVMGDKWPYSWCLVGCWCQDLCFWLILKYWYDFQLMNCCCRCTWTYRLFSEGSNLDGSFPIKTHVLRLVKVHIEVNSSCFLLQAMQQGFISCKCICKKRHVICIVCAYFNFCGISSASYIF